MRGTASDTQDVHLLYELFFKLVASAATLLLHQVITRQFTLSLTQFIRDDQRKHIFYAWFQQASLA